MIRRIPEYILKMLEDNKGSPLIEEGILIGLAILTVTILVGIILSVLGWTGSSITNIFNYINSIVNGLFGFP
ncbi:MAG: hypothetical protein ACUVXA_16055 [Candidatus Jordarchaeum sp.]|uniref:hypothetical protein n=1 Tax=Candidatus Jordarchaeum sp. TaxID=2823881 RepID=UPI00404995CD